MISNIEYYCYVTAVILHSVINYVFGTQIEIANVNPQTSR